MVEGSINGLVVLYLSFLALIRDLRRAEQNRAESLEIGSIDFPPKITYSDVPPLWRVMFAAPFPKPLMIYRASSFELNWVSQLCLISLSFTACDDGREKTMMEPICTASKVKCH